MTFFEIIISIWVVVITIMLGYWALRRNEDFEKI